MFLLAKLGRGRKPGFPSDRSALSVLVCGARGEIQAVGVLGVTGCGVCPVSGLTYEEGLPSW